MLLSSCSKGVQKTSAKLNLKLAGIVNLSSGIGSGGAILFGKSSTGEQFGKVVTGAEENLDLPNGDWSFYTVMWEKTSGNNLSDVAYCGKSFEKLSGTAVSINLNLNNANCADADFSGGNHYQQYVSGAGFKNTFAKFYIEDCDDLAKTGNITCLLPNQGNALSYRMNFRSYKKLPGAAPAFSNEIIRSQCVNVSTLHSSGMNINFPTSNSAMPFVASVEMYLGSNDCGLTQAETKGMYTHVFPQGLAGVNPGSKMVFNGGYSCLPADSIMTDVCVNYMGTPGGTCSVPATISNFVAKADCAITPAEPTTTSFRNIKQMIAIPKSVFCFADTSNFGTSGTDSFPAGNGSATRPLKICNEWQINQIGEIGSAAVMSTYHYKLLNDLDMNKTDLGNYPKPTCSGVAGTLIDKHHNFNPLDGIWDGTCSLGKSSSFSGHFNGNYKTISHARIYAEGLGGLGFVRMMESGSVKNLNFENLEIRGAYNIGGIAGSIFANSAVQIKNIKINGLDLEGKYNSAFPSSMNIGGIAGTTSKNSSSIIIDSVVITDAQLYGRDRIGGLVGANDSTIQRSKFSGFLNVNGGDPATSVVGGLVAQNYGGTITASLSEGMINSDARYTGGVVGLNEASGMLSSVYSTMFIRAFSTQAIPYVGGIVAYNTNSSYENIYFDGVISFLNKTGISTPDLHSISNGDSSSSVSGECYYTDVGNSIGTCNPITRSDLMAGNLFAGSTLWSGTVGALPRLYWEQETNSRPCLMAGSAVNPLTQKNTLGRGTALNPIVICNSTQLSAISTLSSGTVVMLGDDINLSDWTEANLITDFSGVLEGRNHALYGLRIPGAVLNVDGIAIIKNNSGSILNLNVVGNEIFSNVYMPYSGILTAKNSGVIKNVNFNVNSLGGYSSVGAAAGENTGLIEQVEIKNNHVEGYSLVGGAVGNNNLGVNSVGGKILRVSSDSMMIARPFFPNYSFFGGIVGSNCGNCSIDQVLFDGAMALSYDATSSVPFIGGIAGSNGGVISNALTTNRSEIYTLNAEKVGGIAGSNTGIVKTSVAMGRVLYSNPTPMAGGAYFSATVGFSSAGVTSNLYFLEKQTGTVLGQVNTSQACSGTSATFINNLFATIDSNTPDLYLRPYSYYNSLATLSDVVVTGANSMSYADTCVTGDSFAFIKSHGPTGMSAVSFSNPLNFSGLDMGYPGHLEENVIEYHKSRMYKRAPAMAIPVWVMEDGDDHPRLLQVRD